MWSPLKPQVVLWFRRYAVAAALKISGTDEAPQPEAQGR
jgi:hypothetical protein